MDVNPDLEQLSDAELKEMIRELTAEERDISYRRRLLHGRIELLKTELDFGYTLCDVDTDAALVARYGDRVPVLVGGDTEVCAFFLDRDRLREYCGAV